MVSSLPVARYWLFYIFLFYFHGIISYQHRRCFWMSSPSPSTRHSFYPGKLGINKIVNRIPISDSKLSVADELTIHKERLQVPSQRPRSNQTPKRSITPLKKNNALAGELEIKVGYDTVAPPLSCYFDRNTPCSASSKPLGICCIDNR